MRLNTSLVLLALLLVTSSVAAPTTPRFVSNHNKKRDSTSTSSAAESSPTVPYASDAKNYQETGTTQSIVGTLGADIIGPNNIPLDLQNPDIIAGPSTDAGYVKNIKWSFTLSNNRLQTGGWARQQNTDQLPVATEIAGVEMRLTNGSIREMHWHSTAEWAYMLEGTCRISTINSDGQVYVADVNQGDLWYFPSGQPHSIQALPGADNGAEFLLVFDSGDFNEDDTFLLTDWLAHVPKEVIGKNFNDDISDFDEIPSHELYIFPGNPPPEDVKDSMVVPNDTPNPHTYALSQMDATPLAGGSVKIADSTNFKIANNIALAEFTVVPGGMRELHWHPTEPEWTYYLEGQARLTLFAGSGDAQTFDFQPGDVHYIPPSNGHYIENTGNTTLKFLEIFKSDRVQDVSLQQWLALTPPDLVKAHLHLSDEVIDRLNKTKQFVVGPPSNR